MQENKEEIKKLLDPTDTVLAAVNVIAHLSIHSLPLCTEMKCALNLFYRVYSSEAVNCRREVAEGSLVHNLQLKFTDTSQRFLLEPRLRCLL